MEPSIENKKEVQLIIKGIDTPFTKMVGFTFKLGIASLPVLIILFIIFELLHHAKGG